MSGINHENNSELSVKHMEQVLNGCVAVVTGVSRRKDTRFAAADRLSNPAQFLRIFAFRV